MNVSQNIQSGLELFKGEKPYNDAAFRTLLSVVFGVLLKQDNTFQLEDSSACDGFLPPFIAMVMIISIQLFFSDSLPLSIELGKSGLDPLALKQGYAALVGLVLEGAKENADPLVLQYTYILRIPFYSMISTT